MSKGKENLTFTAPFCCVGHTLAKRRLLTVTKMVPIGHSSSCSTEGGALGVIVLGCSVLRKGGLRHVRGLACLPGVQPNKVSRTWGPCHLHAAESARHRGEGQAV